MNGSAVNGIITFEQQTQNDPVQILVNITGLQKGQVVTKHGLHVHQKAINVIESDPKTMCGSSGPHFNPTNTTHGDITSQVRHIGDFGNVIADQNGIILVRFNDTVSKLYGPFGIIGRTIVLHALEDDLGLKEDQGSKATGNSGDRVACGVIGILN